MNTNGLAERERDKGDRKREGTWGEITNEKKVSRRDREKKRKDKEEVRKKELNEWNKSSHPVWMRPS